jgi:hypothetical protein
MQPGAGASFTILADFTKQAIFRLALLGWGRNLILCKES